MSLLHRNTCTPASSGRILDAAGHLRKERVADVADQQADGARAAGHQSTRSRVRLIAQLLRRRVSTLSRVSG